MDLPYTHSLLLSLIFPMFLFFMLVSAANDLSTSSPSLFVFGASMVDIGENSVAMPLRSNADFHPYGSDYFGKPVGRWSNRRNFMDFICLTAKSRMRQHFSDSIYFFKTAHNDYLEAMSGGADYFDLNTTLIATIGAMRSAFQAMYGLGARTFFIMNLTPLGCSPGVLSAWVANEDLDDNNCNAYWMEIVRMHNEHLVELLDELRTEFPAAAAAEWILFDAYNIFLDGYLNPLNYGMQHPFQACCGASGPYNVNLEVACGRSGAYIHGKSVKIQIYILFGISYLGYDTSCGIMEKV